MQDTVSWARCPDGDLEAGGGQSLDDFEGFSDVLEVGVKFVHGFGFDFSDELVYGAFAEAKHGSSPFGGGKASVGLLSMASAKAFRASGYGLKTCRSVAIKETKSGDVNRFMVRFPSRIIGRTMAVQPGLSGPSLPGPFLSQNIGSPW